MTLCVWNKVTEVVPPEGRDFLVWTGRSMLVSDATLYTASYVLGLKDLMGMEYCAMLTKSKGYFQEFGQKYYFDDEEVFWTELPLAPGQEPPQLEQPEYASKDVYLKKDNDIVGIHAVGDVGPDGEFYQLEIWGNQYDDEHNMLGRGSFRVFDQLENEVKNWEADGWVQFEGPIKKDKT